MASNVYFSTMDNHKTKSPLDKIKRVLYRCDIKEMFDKDELVALKVHFGELGNTAFLRPIYLRPVLDILKGMGCKPFLTDTNTLYVGQRSNSVDHIHNAAMNGFNYSTLQVPVIIADGLRGEDSVYVEVNFNLLKSVKLGSYIVNADGLVVISHFKGHEVSGFGGAIKNLSMGCASRAGKMEMHSQTEPLVNAEFCTGCAKCLKNCQVEAISLVEKKAVISSSCVGCSRCIAVCPEGAINVDWNESSDMTQKKMVEYAAGVIKNKGGKIVYVNILTDIVPACDCYCGNDKALVEDIGFLASKDPVALDRASFDLVSAKAGKDPFQEVYPQLKTTLQLDYAKEVGLGSGEYNLIEVE